MASRPWIFFFSVDWFDELCLSMKQTATWVSLLICVSLRVLVTFRYSWFNCLLCLPQKRDLLCGTFTACELAEQNRINAFPLFSHGVGNFFIRPTWQTPAYEEMCERLNVFYGTPESKDWVLHMPHKGDICVVKTPTSCGFRCQRGRVTEVRNSVATVRILLVDSGEEWVEEIIFIFFPSVCCSFFLLLIVLLGYISCVLRWAGFVLFWCNVCTISGLYYQDRSFITFTKCVHNFWVIRRWPSLVSWQMYAPSTEKLVFQTGPIKRSLIYFSLRGFLRYGSSTEKFRILRMLVCFWLFALVTIFTGSGSFAFDEFVGRGKQIFGGVASSRKRRSSWRWYRRLSLPGWLNFSLKWFDTILVLPLKE